MTLTLNDTIELLKAILEECGIECIVLIINLIVAGRTVLVPSFNAIKHTESPSLYPSFSCCFTRILTKIYQEIPCLTPFILPFTPSYFCLLKGGKVPSEPLFLAPKSIFLLLSLKKNNPVFLAILAWVM